MNAMKRHRLWLTVLLMSALINSFHASAEESLRSLDRAPVWLNSPPLTAASLHGKVVLIDFWTYTCINWRRTLPYVRAWAEKYRDQGLIVIGVHTPEFAFEKDIDHIRPIAKAQHVDYPIVVDSDFAIWRAFDNEYWPALYFIDAQGRMRHHVFGEGDYEQSEKIIQQLLAEAGHDVRDRGLVSVEARGAEADADWKNLRSPETYVGRDRAERFVSAPRKLASNEWTVSGDWTRQRESAVLKAARGKIVYRFHARDLHLVMGPATPGTPVRFRVLIDGKPPASAHGDDVDDQGRGTVVEPRMYQLIRQPAPIEDRQFEIEFLDAGAEVFSFTFG